MSGYYPQTTKLKDGNVVSHICLSTEESHVIITYDTLDLTIKEGGGTPIQRPSLLPPPRHGT